MTFDKVCVKCGVEMRVKQNGVQVVKMATFGPLAIHAADLWHCPVCDFEAIFGMADSPIVSTFDYVELEAIIRARQALGIRMIRFWLNDREKQSWERERAQARLREEVKSS